MSIEPDSVMHNHWVEPDNSDRIVDVSETLLVDLTFKVIYIEALHYFDTALSVGLSK